MLLNEVCPLLGNAVEYPPDVPLDSDLEMQPCVVSAISKEAEGEITQLGKFFFSISGTLHPMNANSSCKALFCSQPSPFKPQLNLSAATQMLLPIGVPLEEQCAEGTLLQIIGSKRVYLIENHSVIEMQGVHDLIARNRDFSEVRWVSEKELFVIKIALMGTASPKVHRVRSLV